MTVVTPLRRPPLAEIVAREVHRAQWKQADAPHRAKWVREADQVIGVLARITSNRAAFELTTVPSERVYVPEVHPSLVALLSEREIQVVDALLHDDPGNREIGKRLGLKENTVKTHIARILRKTGVKSRIGLAVVAICGVDT